MDHDVENEFYRHTRDFNEVLDAQGFIEDYDDNNFWEELINRLAVRDVVKKVGGVECLVRYFLRNA